MKVTHNDMVNVHRMPGSLLETSVHLIFGYIVRRTGWREEKFYMFATNASFKLISFL